jgi:hypothetical protein
MNSGSALTLKSEEDPTVGIPVLLAIPEKNL